MKMEVWLSEKVFFRFSWFDVLRRRRLWRSPAAFAAILGVSAVICFALHHIQGAVILGTVLLVAGLGVPAAYFLSYFLSLRKQARQQELADGKYVYTVELYDEENGIAVDNGPEHADYPWAQVHHVYRDGDVTYLYITPERAFLIPHDCVCEGADALWALVERRVPAERRTVL